MIFRLSKLKAKWPLDASTTIAALALFVSVTQVLLSTPLLLDLYVKPRVVVTNMATNQPLPPPNPKFTGFFVQNKGFSTAKAVEIGLVTDEADQIRVWPNLGATITNDKSKVVQNHRVLVPYLSSGEHFTVVVRHHPKSIHELRGQLEGTNSEVVLGPIPSIAYIRSESGLGEIRAAKFGSDYMSASQTKASGQTP